MMGRLLAAACRLYKRRLSPLLPPACRFTPTCSEYAAEAFIIHGALKGAWLTLKRLCRCHPWGGQGHDPVPGGGAGPPGSSTSQLLLLGAGLLSAAGAAAGELPYAPAPIDNPLKGLVPYAGKARDFPHSLEFSYLPLRELLAGPGRYTWEPLDRLLAEVARRGCQTVFRVWLDYPGREPGLPKWLQDAGVALRPPPPGHASMAEGRTPLADYEDPRLRAALRDFILALGARYDQDARVAFITAGLLGWWGEWHTFPASAMMASVTVQDEVMDAYAQAFHRTPVLLRYPRPANAARPFGYHDDSFAWATLSTGKDSWYFLTLLDRAGPLAQARWRTQPMGGETRPELWPTLWDDGGHPPSYQDFTACVRATHASWLMDSSINKPLTPAQRLRAEAGARLLGYEFHVTEASVAAAVAGGSWTLALTIANTGVAPFYRDWPVEVGVLAAGGTALMTVRPPWSLAGLAPGDPPRTWRHALALADLAPGTYRVALRVPNPMPGGRPLRFANRDQALDGEGWLAVGAASR